MSLGADRPTFSVVIPAYNSRGRIEKPLRSLQRQTFRDFEVVVVDSGSQSCATQARQVDPTVRIVRSVERLRPGTARNRGVIESRGQYIAFISDDCVAAPAWLAERVRLHRQGCQIVGGAITNGRPMHPISIAEYLLEYSALVPHHAVLAEQAIPHAVSFCRAVFDRFGPYPEDTLTGEDTLFNRRCVQANLRTGFTARASVAHYGSTRLSEMLSHAYAHGRGLAQCVESHELGSRLSVGAFASTPSALRSVCAYALEGWIAKFGRLRRGAPRLLPAFLALSPIIVLASTVTAAGTWREYRRSGRARLVYS